MLVTQVQPNSVVLPPIMPNATFTPYKLPVSSRFKPASEIAAREAARLASIRWTAKTSPDANDAKLAAQCGISPVTAAILRIRGHDTPDKVRCFLEPELCGLHDPMLLPDIRPAIARLHRAITTKEPILIYGDYDVDGVTSTALLVRSLRSLGANVEYKIPERKGEGYGMNVAAIEEAHANGITFILTADCGIRDLEPARRARELGIDLVITDHHEPGTELPEALAIINPKRADSQYPFDELSGCGVAFKVMQALLQEYWPRYANSFWEKFVDLAGMAAIADCVPLRDENRILAREGLRRLASTNKLGILALMKVARLKITGDTLRGSHVGFSLAPRLNAAGRLDSALKSLQLLMSSDGVECEALALELEDHNTARRELQNRIVDEACDKVKAEIDLDKDLVIVVAGSGWHGGVMGLVAGRLAERYSRPAIVLNLDNGIAHGSGRTASGFNLHSVIEITHDIIIKGGGHEAACGLSLTEDNLAEFRTRVLKLAADSLTHADLVPHVEADCEVTGRDLNLQLARDLEKLEPCGQGNPEARLMLRGATILDGKSMGAKGEHLKWFINADGQRFEAVW
ncbi:MAG TPA: single-stranded-DNA-specific exonuclease RecJ, partial [Abditibacteriaceae bacterium]